MKIVQTISDASVAASSLWEKRGLIERVSNISPEAFEKRFISSHENEGRPVIITDAMESWPCRTKWTFDFFIVV